MHWPEVITNGLWRGAIAVIPLALVTAAICRQLKYRPGARHALWLITLLGLIAIPFVPAAVKPSVEVIELAPAPVQIRQPTLRDDNEAVADASDIQPDADALLPDHVAIAEPAIDVYFDQRDVSQQNEPCSAAPIYPQVILDLATSSDSDTEVEIADAPTQFDHDVELLAKIDESPRADSSQTTPAQSKSFIQRHIPVVVGAWRKWVGQLAATRDALGGISPIPASLWIFGALLYAALYWFNALRWKRRIMSADKAPYDTRQLVHRVARSLGLKRAPQCVIVSQRISPMIWCGWPQRLVLPAELWDELDADERIAVVTHELAHMRRRDHWVRWVDVAVGCLYWWHPVVWWVRSRISAEAENCCDAWVTWLNPKSRRAYAEALLTARQFISSDVHAAPALGIGAATRKSKNFARRLTMIMTRKDAPGMAATDWFFGIAVVCAGWLAIPAHSGAAEPPEADSAYAVVASDDGVITVGGTDSVAPVVTTVASVPAAHGVAAHSIAAHDHHDAHDHGDHNDALESRLDRLERQMSRLMDLMEEKETRSRRGGVVSRRRAPLPTPSTPAVPSIRPSHPTQSITSGLAKRPKGLQFKNSYKMPAGQLEAMIKLMSRDDVPVLISPGRDSITVHGTAEQLEVFKRFVEAIGSDKSKRIKIGGGKLDALSELMIRDDVPIRVAPGDDHIDVIGSPAEQQAVADFVKLIQGKSVSSAPSVIGRTFWKDNQYPFGKGQSQSTGLSFSKAQEAYRSARENAAKSRTLAIRAERNALRDQARQLRRQAQSLKGQRETIEQAAEQIQEQAEKLRERQDRSREQMDELRDRTDRVDAESKSDAIAGLATAYHMVSTIQSQIDQAASEVDAHALEAEFLELQINELEMQADRLEDRSDELEEEAEVTEGDSEEIEEAVEL